MKGGCFCVLYACMCVFVLKPEVTETFKTGNMMNCRGQNHVVSMKETLFYSMYIATQSLIDYIDGCHAYQ